VFNEPAELAVAGARAVRVVAFNVNVGNGDFAGIDRYLASLDPDVVVLEEITVWSVDQLAPILPKLPHRYQALDDGVRGVVILSRWPLIDPQLVTLDGRMFGARVDVNLGDRQFRLHGVHLNWPVFPAAERVRNAQLGTLGRELTQCPGACVVVGDFNVTPWSSHYRDLLGIPGVRDCAAGRGWLPTWNSSLPAVLRIRIDQCVASGTMGVAEVRVGEAVGSDHFATINVLSVPVPRDSRPTTENAGQGPASVE
jgi:endonuclease/exonuclease/phosphatase (EEP) superfamily protein YafD